MGVKGLWRLINCSGTPVPLESLENKILAVDVSIWLHQAVRGFKGVGVAAVANAHLLTLFHRICKLLFYRIKPVFIFDGAVPQLKRQTLSARRLKRELAAGKARKVRERLLINLLKSQAVRKTLGKKGQGPVLNYVAKSVQREKDLFELPPLPEENQLLVCNKKASEKEDKSIFKNLKAPNLHNFEFESSDFKSLAIEKQHEILSELQDTRKQSSWNMINNMPQESRNFAGFQMERLLKRRKFQKTLDGIRSEIRQKHAKEMELLLFGELETHVSLTHRIISEDETHSILIKNVKNDQEQVSSRQLEDQIKSCQGKLFSSKHVGKQDFLTELAKHGIVTNTNRNCLPKDSSETEEDSSSDDETYCPLRKKRKLDEIAFLKAMDYVLEENEFTQEELLTLIHQSKYEDNASPVKRNINSAKKYFDINMPSTSASGLIDDKSETDSSEDDEDFIDVSFPDDSITSFPCGEISCNQSLCQTGKECIASPTKGSNIDSIRNAQTNSLYLKIMQQKLDDIVVKTSYKYKNTGYDTRKQSQYSISENKNIAVEQSSKVNDSVNPTNDIAISLDIANEASVTKCDELFADIFCEQIDKTSKSTIKDNSNCKEILNVPESAGSFERDNLIKKGSHHNFGPCIHNELIEKHAVSNSVLSNGTPTLLTDQLKDKISELLEIELKKIISNATSVGQENDLQKKNETGSGIDLFSVKYTNNYDKLCSEKPLQNKISEHLKSRNDTIEVLSNSGTIKKAVEARCTIPIGEHIETSSLNENKLFSASGSNVDLPEINSEEENTIINVDDDNIPSPENFSSNMDNDYNYSNQIIEPVTNSENELKEIENQLAKEKNSLIAEARSHERVATELSDQVYGEAQELLQLFGLPYLVAPMEAEAQCAFLDQIGLTQGTITDDSDIFLFGGHRVYKHLFNQSKHVEFFKLDNIKHNFGLDRDKMITLALLTGSDYTTGIESVGTVLGMEILAEFPGNGINCLKSFKRWWKSAHINMPITHTSKIKQRLSSLYLPESFPSENIFKAYLEPDVDESREKFSWVMPNVKGLVNFTSEKFGWNESKSREILIPILEKLGLKETQLRIDSYFNNIKLIKGDTNTSKRLTEAIQKYKGEVGVNESASNKNLSKIAKYKVAISKSKQKNKRTLLIDPADGIYCPGSLPTTLKTDPPVKQMKRTKKENLTQLPPNAAINLTKKMTKFCDEEKSGKPLTKSERKKLIYEKLLEKEKIMQSESDKKKMLEKKKLAAKIFQSQKK